MNWFKAYAQGAILIALLIAANALLHLAGVRRPDLSILVAPLQVLWMLVSALLLTLPQRPLLALFSIVIFLCFSIALLSLEVAAMLSFGRSDALAWLTVLRQSPHPLYVAKFAFSAFYALLNVLLCLKPEVVPASNQRLVDEYADVLSVSPADSNRGQLTLVKAQLDLSTFKTQLVVSAIIALFGCLSLYLSADFHSSSAGEPGCQVLFRQVSAVGWWRAILQENDRHLGLGPLASISLAADRWLFGRNSSTWHLTNFLLLGCSSILFGQIACQLGRRWGNRLGGTLAVWGSLLFVFNPWSATMAASLDYRAVCLGQLFLLATIFCYLRLRSQREAIYLPVGLSLMLAGVAAHPFVAVAPLLVFVCEMACTGQADEPASVKKSRSWLNTTRFTPAAIFAAVDVLAFNVSLFVGMPMSTPNVAQLKQAALCFFSGATWLSLIAGDKFDAVAGLILPAQMLLVASLLIAALRIVRKDLTAQVFLLPAVWILSVFWSLPMGFSSMSLIDQGHSGLSGSGFWGCASLMAAGCGPYYYFGVAPFTLIMLFVLLPGAGVSSLRQVKLLVPLAAVLLSVISVVEGLAAAQALQSL